MIDGDCDEANDLASSDFRGSSEIDSACGGAPDGTRIVDAELDRDDPVVVVVEYVADDDDQSGDFPLEMIEDDGEWRVNGLYDGGPIDDGTTGSAEPGSATAGPDGDPEQIAEEAIQALINGDCSAALAFGTLDFITEHGADLCITEPLPRPTRRSPRSRPRAMIPSSCPSTSTSTATRSRSSSRSPRSSATC